MTWTHARLSLPSLSLAVAQYIEIKLQAPEDQLKHEARCFKIVKNYYTPRLLAFGRSKHYIYLVTDLVSTTSSLKEKRPTPTRTPHGRDETIQQMVERHGNGPPDGALKARRTLNGQHVPVTRNIRMRARDPVDPVRGVAWHGNNSSRQ
ncbi:hypothetical protein FISHEDRAFT_58372 [Fistulina hepatica ATCC 64428]|nr:hypothetical protein FISHEDRAFT_58372 [Fistulina hepatica ATCC 64428]